MPSNYFPAVNTGKRIEYTALLQPNGNTTPIQNSNNNLTPGGANQIKLGDVIMGKKLAVINIVINTRGISADILNAITDFIINAFVNKGIGTVVDRKNIADIMKEYSFQQSDLVDINTVVRIGKLAGADFIVTGSISMIEGIYYLNLQVKNVSTGEIVGSNIANTNSRSNFLEMCNEAVNKLF